MRDFIDLHINGVRYQVTGEDAFCSLSDFLRIKLGLVGTKIVCSEGDCGACTVLCGRLAGGAINYQPVDSCIQFMFQLDGTHIVTVEGLRPEGGLTSIQQSMIDCHGSQCGYCTPGFVVAMTGHCETAQRLDEKSLRRGLTGNLCRCTGYAPIVQAGLDAEPHVPIEEVYVSQDLIPALSEAARTGFHVRHKMPGRVRQAIGPTQLQDVLRALADHAGAKLVAGATDIGVQLNKGLIDPDVFVDLNRVHELREASVTEDPAQRAWQLGTCATWTQLEALAERDVPEFHGIISVFGSPQIRHVGTIGGNIINASPIADALPFLFVMGASLELQSDRGVRSVNINDFYRGYKQFDLAPGELLTRIHIPLPTPEDILRLYKVSRRRDLDISTFTAAVLMRLEGDTIRTARIAFGAVGPTVIRAHLTEEYLVGKTFRADTLRSAGNIAVTEISPISDVRGSAEYRCQLTRNILLKFFYEYDSLVAA